MKKEIKDIAIGDFDYNLDESRIAIHPLSERDQSKLLVYNKGVINSASFKDLPSFLMKNSLLVFNNTKVVHARLPFRRPSGARIEVFLLEPVIPSDYSMSFAQNQRVIWCCIIGNLKRWKEPELRLEIPGYDSVLVAKKVRIINDGAEVELSWNNPALSFARIVELCGEVPIPPYLNRGAEQEDKIRYQTVYAKPEGSVAAPTAGLHFTDEVFESLEVREIPTEFITLHVGAGTFKPVKSARILEHEMHSEHFTVTLDLIQRLINTHGTTVAVGTTTLRTLESIYWLGVQLANGETEEPCFVTQWYPYNDVSQISKDDALKALTQYMYSRKLDHLNATTQIMIAPGYQFRMVDALITNFHQPKSTLILLVSAFIGDDWRAVYDFALANDFRFLSYGDSSLLFRKEID